MLPHFSSPYPQANQAAVQQPQASNGPIRPRQGPRNTASKSYVKGVESSVKTNANRLNETTERMDYIESFLSSKYGAQYEPFAIFKARENLSFTTSEITSQWALGARNDSVGSSNAGSASNACGDMTPRSSNYRKKMCIEHVFFSTPFFQENGNFSKSSKLVETFQKDAPGDTDHGEPLCGQKY